MRTSGWVAVAAWALLLHGAGCGGGGDDDDDDDAAVDGGGPDGAVVTGICDAPGLTAALATAGPGDTIVIGSCTISGEFVVPAGVTVKGSGIAASTVTTRLG